MLEKLKTYAAHILLAAVALIHARFMYIEMFDWEVGGRAALSIPPDELFKHGKILAFNTGLYNGFFVLGIIWVFTIKNSEWQKKIALALLGCIAIAGLVGGWTAGPLLYVAQALPAALAIAVIVLFGIKKSAGNA